MVFYDSNINTRGEYHATNAQSIDNLIDNSNIIILSASYTEDNFEFFNRDYLNMLENKYLVNTARGELIDEEYLLQKIEEDFFAGVALDVIQNEQTENNFQRFIKLVSTRNLIITPHISGATFTSMQRTEEFIAQKLVSSVNSDYLHKKQ